MRREHKAQTHKGTTILKRSQTYSTINQEQIKNQKSFSLTMFGNIKWVGGGRNKKR